jgi:two-component system, NtrC family, sensor kinase
VNAAVPPLPARKSLRAKGLLATLALMAYLLGAGLYIAYERGEIYQRMVALDALGRHEKALALAEAAVNGALIDVSESSSAATSEPGPPTELRLYMENCAKLFEALDEFDPRYVLLQRSIERAYGALTAHPVRASWIDLRESLRRAVDGLEIRRQALGSQRDELTIAYQRQYDAVTVESLMLAVIGLVAFGTLAAWFFTTLAGDIRRLEAHAREVVQGTRGIALPVRRADELGHLMHAVNRMAADLDEREQQIRLDGERRLHQEKMLAVGALAAGVAHEVNNPLAVITGTAQALRDAADAPDPGAVVAAADLILAQAQRAAQAARQLADVAAPRPQDLDWVDLNALLRDVVRLMGFDKRYRRVEWALETDPALPALRSSASAIQQVLMQMLTLVGEAVTRQGNGALAVRIETLRENDSVAVRMLLAPALDFTRGEVQRGLLLARAIIEPLHGRLALGQVEDGRQRIKLTLPAEPGSE